MVDSQTDAVPYIINGTTHEAITYAVDAGTPRISCNSARTIRLGVVGVELNNAANQRSVGNIRLA